MFEERATGKYIMTHIFCDGEEMSPSEVVGLLNTLHQENEQLRKKCFELEKDYLIETSDEVDKALYLEDDLKKLANEYGVEDE